MAWGKCIFPGCGLGTLASSSAGGTFTSFVHVASSADVKFCPGRWGARVPSRAFTALAPRPRRPSGWTTPSALAPRMAWRIAREMPGATTIVMKARPWVYVAPRVARAGVVLSELPGSSLVFAEFRLTLFLSATWLLAQTQHTDEPRQGVQVKFDLSNLELRRYELRGGVDARLNRILWRGNSSPQNLLKWNLFWHDSWHDS